ncbi:UDP-Glycosyltransferase/glycogen phosphorylase [Hesseltinella vesiculosa]|uniref:sterol 3beta-glucosyltransferase n=1 Tax=Hesseltinella vesiculosa TaxID=101127 RepID=A0A1X2G8D5_9FUNG|nr:UDP-Glycosyltransferase/glycogen phosphorylase [Hesseltinella vesiculosa]
MALEAQDAENSKAEESSTDLGRSIEAISSTQTWSDIDAMNDGQVDTNLFSPVSNERLRELLAEASEAAPSEAIPANLSSSLSSEDNDLISLDQSGDNQSIASSTAPARINIDQTVQRIFELPTMEHLIAEWPCYIVLTVVVPGFLYLTEQHVCFYAPLPKIQTGYHRTGYLLVKAPSTIGSRYRRCFFDLNHDTLTWYENANDTYFPLGKIDLKYAVSVKRSKRRPFGIRMVTVNKSYHFQADTESAMNEWLTAVQKAIFKAKNTGSNFKLKFPFSSILDIEHSEVDKYQQLLMISVVDVEDEFVMDEYYFAYFPDIKGTFDQLQSALGSHPAHKKDQDDQPILPPSQESPPPLSFADMYHADKPIVIPSLSNRTKDISSDPSSQPTHQPSHQLQNQRLIRASSAVSNMVPDALKGLFYSRSQEQPLSTPDTNTPDNDEEALSSSSSEDDKTSWLGDKGRSGMKQVYGFLGSSSSTDVSADPSGQHDHDHRKVDQQSSEPRAGGELLDEKVQDDFRKYFALPESETLLSVFRCYLAWTLPCYGKLYISTNHVSFNSKGFGTKAKMILPLEEVQRIQKMQSNVYSNRHSINILTRKKTKIFLDFSSLAKRNSCFAQLYLRHKQFAQHDQAISEPEHRQMKEQEIRLLEAEQQEQGLTHRTPPSIKDTPLLSSTNDDIQYTKPDRSLHFTCITIGTRGDVQPYIALCKSLAKDGHRCRIATHDEFKDWIEEHEIEFRSIGGDPSELMRFCVENNFFSVNFVMEGLKLFKVWIDELLELAWTACEGTDVLLESPSAMVGVHMAEKLRIPYFRSFPMPMTRTPSFPHPFATPNRPKGTKYNEMTYVLFDHAVWRAISARTNSFREQVLGLPATTYDNLEVPQIPYLYSFSTSIVPSPEKWKDWVHCTGYWFLDNPNTGWQPDERMLSFLNTIDSRPIVYIGFGSIIVTEPQEVVRTIVEAVLLSNVRAVVSEGWSSRNAQEGDNVSNLLHQYPDVILPVASVPHDWLFPKMRAVVHHGGAGTTAAGLRAGCPTIVKPFFADQFFWGDRVEVMGVGKCVRQLTATSLSAALRTVTTDDVILKNARLVGEKIRSETGVETAIQYIYRDMELAHKRTLSSARRANAAKDNGDSNLEEWTIVEPSQPNSSAAT